MGLLDNVVEKVRRDGSFTEGWTAIRYSYFADEQLYKVPGSTNMERLQAWAQSRCLVMDFEMEGGGSSNTIQNVTFRDARQDVEDVSSGQATYEAERAVQEGFEWDSAAAGSAGAEAAWMSVSRDTDHAFIG